jgi:hypothetical protein
MELVKFPSINQFRHVINTISHHTEYVNKDSNEKVQYNTYAIKPTVKFIGTVKLHGSNSGIVYDVKSNTIHTQSRNQILSIQDDNYKFAQFVENNKKMILSFFQCLVEEIDGSVEQIVIFGEWCGGSIKKKIGINKLEKMFVLFDIQVNDKWMDVDFIKQLKLPTFIKNIYDFKTYSISIDFNNPNDFVNELIDITMEVEKECPVAKQMGIIGIGEGVVWKAIFNNERYIFKVKGDKHSATKVKQLISISPEKLKSVNDFLDYALTDNRFEQAIDTLFTSTNEQITIERTGDVLKWLKNDIFKEEMDTLKASNLQPSDIAQPLTKKAVLMFSKFIG